MRITLTALLVALSSTSAFHLSSHRTVPSTTLLRYKGSDFDDTFSSNNDNNNNGVGGDNFWSALVHTERWISDTLDRSNQAEMSRQQQQQQQQQNDNGQTMHFADEKKDSGIKDNPYARKEVSYVCEIGSDLASVVGGIFRRVREARELGERHGRDVESRLGSSSSSSSSDANPTTMRSTNVVVIPSCNELATFQTFDALVQSINQARRAARDFVVAKKKDDEDDGTKEWV
jgi:HD superfamily phosphohydrolase